MNIAANAITVTLPAPVLNRLRRVAELTYRSVDDVLASTVSAALAAPPDVPSELADELAAMHVLSDEALWAAAQPVISAAEQQRLHQLNHIAGERELMQAEAGEQTALLHAYHRSMLHRAQALAILAQRGHPVVSESLSALSGNGEFADSRSAA